MPSFIPRGALAVLVAFGLVSALGALGCDRAQRAGGLEAPSREAAPAPPRRTPPPPTSAPASGGEGNEAREGAIAGRVVYRGPLPSSRTMYVPEAGTIEAHTIIADPASGSLKSAVVWVEGAPAAGGGAELPASFPAAVIDQRNWTFVPHVLPVRAGQEVRFLNSDIANHNVHSFHPGEAFNLGTPTGSTPSRRFRRPTGADPVRLQCDIHDWMLAWIYVFEHGAFAVTGEDGAFRIAGLPPGRWTVRAHHADGGLEAALEVDLAAGAEALIELEARARRGEPGPHDDPASIESK
jgi:plastocyanin